jgi:hypothetical protein
MMRPVATRRAMATSLGFAAPALATATLELRSEPRGATFIVDGVAVGPGPIDVPVSADRAIEISAALPHHETWTRRVHAVAGRTAVLAELPIEMDATTVSPRDERSSRSRSRRD